VRAGAFVRPSRQGARGGGREVIGGGRSRTRTRLELKFSTSLTALTGAKGIFLDCQTG
jgi:hypothetical protein